MSQPWEKQHVGGSFEAGYPWTLPGAVPSSSSTEHLRRTLDGRERRTFLLSAVFPPLLSRCFGASPLLPPSLPLSPPLLLLTDVLFQRPFCKRGLLCISSPTPSVEPLLRLRAPHSLNPEKSYSPSFLSFLSFIEVKARGRRRTLVESRPCRESS